MAVHNALPRGDQPIEHGPLVARLELIDVLGLAARVRVVPGRPLTHRPRHILRDPLFTAVRKEHHPVAVVEPLPETQVRERHGVEKLHARRVDFVVSTLSPFVVCLDCGTLPNEPRVRLDDLVLCQRLELADRSTTRNGSKGASGSRRRSHRAMPLHRAAATLHHHNAPPRVALYGRSSVGSLRLRRLRRRCLRLRRLRLTHARTDGHTLRRGRVRVR